MEKKFDALPPVTRLIVARCDLSNGNSFIVVTDLEPTKWESISNKWLRKTKRYTMESLIAYVTARNPYCICVSKQDYDAIVEGLVIPATKEEYDRENN